MKSVSYLSLLTNLCKRDMAYFLGCRKQLLRLNSLRRRS